VTASPTLIGGQNLQPIFEEEEVKDPADDQEAIEHPRLKQTIQEIIPPTTSLGVFIHSHLANFCQYYSFISPMEPVKVEKALEDEDWVMAMQEESNNFERNQV
jgi:hypothetical protein